MISWKKIHAEVDGAIKEFAQSQYISSRKLSEYMMEHPSQYPSVVTDTQKTTTAKITASMRMRKWEQWSSVKPGGRQKVFIIPGWVG